MQIVYRWGTTCAEKAMFRSDAWSMFDQVSYLSQVW